MERAEKMLFAAVIIILAAIVAVAAFLGTWWAGDMLGFTM